MLELVFTTVQSYSVFISDIWNCVTFVCAGDIDVVQSSDAEHVSIVHIFFTLLFGLERVLGIIIIKKLKQ